MCVKLCKKIGVSCISLEKNVQTLRLNTLATSSSSVHPSVTTTSWSRTAAFSVPYVMSLNVAMSCISQRPQSLCNDLGNHETLLFTSSAAPFILALASLASESALLVKLSFSARSLAHLSCPPML